MFVLEEFVQKQNNIIQEFEILYENYKFNDLVEHIKNIKGNFENAKQKFIETKKEKCFNYLNYFRIYANIMKHEKDFVLFSKKDNPIESNIGKGTNSYIVSQHGYRWIKIISKNADFINNSFNPDYYDNYCIMDDIDKFINDVNKSNYLPFNEKPELFIVFLELPNEEVIEAIKEKNISLISIDNTEKCFIASNKITKMLNSIKIINLDVNIIITICSELSNLDKNDKINIPTEIITKCITGNVTSLEEIIENKNFIIENLKKYDRRIICQSAYNKLEEFKKILSEKPNFSKEICRIKTVFNGLNIEIVPDQITERIKSINHPNKLANSVFGTGDYYHAITISGFGSYIHNAKQNRVIIANIPCNSVEFSEKYLIDYK